MTKGGLADLGGELLEARRGVQGEEPCGGRDDDVGVAKTPRQDRYGAGPCDVFLLAGNYPQLAVEHEEGLVVARLSRQIRDLERALGVTLFDRTSRRVALSRAGQAVLAQARRALNESDRAIRLARLAAHGDWGELSLDPPMSMSTARVVRRV
jgi:hypothetical protein